MAWDPTDYKDMLDDDWNDIYDNVLQTLNDDLDEYDKATKVAWALQRNDIMDTLRTYFLGKNSKKLSNKEIANQLMNDFYLTPMGRKRLRNKMNIENMKSKYVKESLNESDFDLWSGDESENTGVRQEVLSTLVDVFDKAASAGISFEELQEVIEEALNDTDWVQYEDEDFDDVNLTDTEKLDKKYPYPR